MVSDPKQKVPKFCTMHFGISMCFKVPQKNADMRKYDQAEHRYLPGKLHKIVTNSLDAKCSASPGQLATWHFSPQNW